MSVKRRHGGRIRCLYRSWRHQQDIRSVATAVTSFGEPRFDPKLSQILQHNRNRRNRNTGESFF
jgi:hypothetical protein